MRCDNRNVVSLASSGPKGASRAIQNSRYRISAAGISSAAQDTRTPVQAEWSLGRFVRAE